MKKINRRLILFALLITSIFSLDAEINAQQKSAIEIFNESALNKIVPKSFYFAGQSADTQMRNAAAVRIGENRHVIAGMVDTSGYSTEISGKYEGFFITDSPIIVGGKTLETGAYGFGFSTDGKLNFFDLSSKEIMSVATTSDAQMRRPRPLMMTVVGDSVRFYKGKNYALITPK